MRAATIILTAFLAASPVLAQEPGETTPPTSSSTQERTASPTAAGDKDNQRIERIRVEDGGSRIDELRVGGETKNITVQPKVGNLPAYEVQPANKEGADGTNGRRVWRALQF